jgi:3D (Asp-Asp-Asp) domain-containing protein
MRSLFTAAALYFFVAAAQLTSAGAARPEFDNIHIDARKKIGDLKPTFYWVALEERNDGPSTYELKDLEGRVLARVSEKFWRAIRLEGTGKLLDGRVLNYDGRVTLPDGTVEIRYVVCPKDAPYGYGLERRKLVPFRSVAIDPRVVPMDSTVYIPKARGARLPDGSIHDGYFRAIDIGDAIQNKRIDIFTSLGDQSEVFRRHGLNNMKAVAVYLVE